MSASYYALLDGSNIVTEVISGVPQNTDGVDWEAEYGNRYGVVCKMTYKQLVGGQLPRKNYAGVGYTYDDQRDAFIPPKPYSKWLLDEATCTWQPPVPYPSDDLSYVWDDLIGSWVSPS